MTLSRLEQDFQSFVLAATPGIEQEVVGTPRVPVDVRLSIYSDAYGARLTEALENNYPVLAKLLGGRQFRELAQAYIRTHRSAHFSIRWYGDRLADMLAAEAPYNQELALAELALWEWSMTLAFDAREMPLLTPQMLRVLSPEEWSELHCKTQPCVQILSLHTNAPALWRALDREEAPPAPQRLETAQDWLIWRRDLEVFFRSLSSGEARVLRRMMHGESFGAICESLAEQFGEDQAPLEAAKLLSQWMTESLLSA